MISNKDLNPTKQVLDQNRQTNKNAIKMKSINASSKVKQLIDKDPYPIKQINLQNIVTGIKMITVYLS